MLITSVQLYRLQLIFHVREHLRRLFRQRIICPHRRNGFLPAVRIKPGIFPPIRVFPAVKIFQKLCLVSDCLSLITVCFQKAKRNRYLLSLFIPQLRRKGKTQIPAIPHTVHKSLIIQMECQHMLPGSKCPQFQNIVIILCMICRCRPFPHKFSIQICLIMIIGCDPAENLLRTL